MKRCAVLIMAIGAATGGCVFKPGVSARVDAAEQTAAALRTFHDFELARAASAHELARLEGLYRADPENERALELLTQGWASVSIAFVTDEAEQALESEVTPQSSYHLARVRASYERGRHYGVKWLTLRDVAMDVAGMQPQAMARALREHFDEAADAEPLLWTGISFAGPSLAGAAGDPQVNARIGEAMLERSVELDERAAHGLGHVVLGSVAAPGSAEARQHFDRALALSGGGYLPAKVALALHVHCPKGDRASYERTLHEVLTAADPIPEARLANVVAKRRARRYLGDESWWRRCRSPRPG